MRTKTEERLQRKKKKVMALVNVMSLNEADRQRGGEEPEPKKAKIEQQQEETATLSDGQFKELKKELNKKRDQLRNVPRIRLKLIGDKAQLDVKQNQKQPLVLADLQHLLMQALLKSSSPFTPWRWCHIEKLQKLSHTIVLVVDGLSAYDFVSNESKFEKTTKIFDLKLEVALPPGDDKKIIESLACVPLTESYRERLIRQHGSLEAALAANLDHKLVYRTVFPVEQEQKVKFVEEDDTEELPEADKYSRTQLLLSPLQMIDEDYPVPLSGALADRCKSYIMSQDKYIPVTAKSPMFGLDCEMCKVVTGRSEVTRVSIVNEAYESVYETLVRPEYEIKDYLTQFSGITKEMMESATKTLAQVQEEVKQILTPDAILVGQSLQFDLHGLRMMHPYIIDTSVIFNISGDRVRKSKLQALAKEFLGEDIQKAYTGHNSIEDSCASLKLAKLKLARDVYFGDTVLQQKKMSHTSVRPSEQSSTPQQEITTTIFSHAAKKHKKSAIISNSDVNYEDFFQREPTDNPIKYFQVSSAKKAMSKACEVALEHELTLTHIKVKNLEEEQKDQLIAKVDKWISKLWNALAMNGLLVVVMAAGNNNTGVALVQVKNVNNSSKTDLYMSEGSNKSE